VIATPVALVACGLDPSGLAPAGDVADGAGTSTGVSDGAPPATYDAYVSPTPGTDAASPPPPPSDASTASDAPPTQGCDQDGDGHAARGGCEGDDCCDTDARAHPGDLVYFDAEDACGSFDYDCNGTDDPQYPVANCQLDFFGGACGGDGFAATTACGATADYTTCSYAVFGCNTSSATRTQGCR
jgi:hypothetical protein